MNLICYTYRNIAFAAVEVGAANLTDPLACKRIIEELPEAMDRYGIRELSELGGKN